MATIEEMKRANSEFLAACHSKAAGKARPRKVGASYKSGKIGKPLAGHLALNAGSEVVGKRHPGCKRRIAPKWAGILGKLKAGTLSPYDIMGGSKYHIAGHCYADDVHVAMALAKWYDAELIQIDGNTDH